jgi:hypothetical protein
MKYSKHNIFSRISGSENHFIVNLLSGNADILDSTDAGKIESIRKGEAVNDTEFLKEIAEKGYLVDESEEKKVYRSKYLDFIDSRENDEIQIFLVTN